MSNLTLKFDKNFMWTQILTYAILLITPITPALLITGVIVVVDFLTGIYASYKKGRKITSRRMRDTVEKLLIYYITILLAFLVQKHMLQDVLPVLRVALGFICLSEFKSISENFENISGINMYKKAKQYFKKKHDIDL